MTNSPGMGALEAVVDVRVCRYEPRGVDIEASAFDLVVGEHDGRATHVVLVETRNVRAVRVARAPGIWLALERAEGVACLGRSDVTPSPPDGRAAKL